MGTSYNGKNIANKDFFEKHVGYLAFSMCLQCTPHTEVTEENYMEIAKVIFEKNLMREERTREPVPLERLQEITKAAVGFWNGCT